MWARPWAGLIALSACSSPLGVGLPDGRAFVFAFEHPDRVELRAVGDAAVEPIWVDRGGITRATAIAYDRPLAEMALAEGPLRQALPSEPMRALPMGRPFGGEVSGGRFSGWTPIADLPPRVAAVRLPAPPAPPCPAAAVRQLPLESTVSVTFAISIDPDTALLATEDGRFYRATADGVTEVNVPAGLPHESASLGGPRELWLGGGGGDLVRVDPTMGFAVTHRAPIVDASERLLSIAASPEGVAIEVFAISFRGQVVVYDGRGWTGIVGPDTNLMERFGRRILRLGPGRAIASTAGTRLLLYEGGAKSWISLGGGMQELNAIALVPGIGLITSALGGETFVGEETPRLVWRSLGRSGLDLNTYAIAPFQGGFVYAGTLGFVGRYTADGRFCPEPLPVAGLDSIQHAIPLGASTVLLAGRRSTTDGEKITVTMLKY